MATTATNIYIGPSDGWVQIAPTASDFIRVSAFPHTHPYFITFGASAPSLLPVSATGTVTFSGLPTADETATIGSEVYTFKASATEPFEVTIGADADETGDNFVSAVEADSTLVTASNSSGTVTLTAIAAGDQGNIGLSEDATNTAVSGANLTGGADVAVGIRSCHEPFWIDVTTDAACWARVQNSVPNSNRQDGKLRLDVVNITS